MVVEYKVVIYHGKIRKKSPTKTNEKSPFSPKKTNKTYFLVGDANPNPSFATGTERGLHPNFISQAEKRYQPSEGIPDNFTNFLTLPNISPFREWLHRGFLFPGWFGGWLEMVSLKKK